MAKEDKVQDPTKKEKKKKRKSEAAEPSEVTDNQESGAAFVTHAIAPTPGEDADGDVSMAVDGEDGEPKKKKSSKKEKKDKKGRKSEGGGGGDDEEADGKENLEDAISPIAHPLAEKKLAKKVLRTVKKASKARHVKRGVKEVVKSIRKGEKGMIVMAGDISPMDILTHIPLLAEESSNPYVFVPSKETLGQASATKRPTSCVMLCPAGTMVRKKPKVPRKDKDGNLVPVKEDDPEKEKEKEKDREEYREAYEEVVKEVQALDERITY